MIKISTLFKKPFNQRGQTPLIFHLNKTLFRSLFYQLGLSSLLVIGSTVLTITTAHAGSYTRPSPGPFWNDFINGVPGYYASPQAVCDKLDAVNTASGFYDSSVGHMTLPPVFQDACGNHARCDTTVTYPD